MIKKLNLLKYFAILSIIIGALILWKVFNETLSFDKKTLIIIGVISSLIGYVLLIIKYRIMKINHKKKGDFKRYFFNYSLGEVFLFLFSVLIINQLIEKLFI